MCQRRFTAVPVVSLPCGYANFKPWAVAVFPSCQWRGRPFKDADPPTTDHVVARALGGSDDVRNLVLSCRTCNGVKGCRRVQPDRCLRGPRWRGIARELFCDVPDVPPAAINGFNFCRLVAGDARWRTCFHSGSWLKCSRQVNYWKDRCREKLIDLLVVPAILTFAPLLPPTGA